MNNNFYRAFEDKFRGSHDLIRGRLLAYKPFLEALGQFDNKQAIDLGCGRGEWLDVLSCEGFNAIGVDLDLGMLEACRERGFRVQHQDAIEALKELEDSSVMLVSGFHIAEHLQFEVLQLLIQESLRVLKPGGLLILETPNPENISVSTVNFYLDPTHSRPIPSLLLSFLHEYYGFERTKVLRLQESENLNDIKNISLKHVINGVSPDYAVVAQKNAHPELLKAFDELFAKEYGLSLDSLMNKFENRLSSIEQRVTEAELDSNSKEMKINDLNQSSHFWFLESKKLENKNHLLENSFSWKLTYPLRFMNKIMKKIFSFIKLIYQSIFFLIVKLPLQLLFKCEQKGYICRVLVKVLFMVPYFEKYAIKIAKVTIFIDITHVYKNDLKTGIQRVVRSVVKYFPNYTEKYMDIVHVYSNIDGVDNGFFNIKTNIKIQPLRGDYFIGLDLNSDIINISGDDIFNKWKIDGVNIIFIIYDILPILHPEWWPLGVSDTHKRWVDATLKVSNKIICISEAVASDIQKYLQSNQKDLQSSPEILSFILGSDINNSNSSTGLPQNYKDTLELINTKITFLIVGTLEPRKGHTQTLDAFEILWADGVDVHLVIVGKVGWMVEKLIMRIENHQELNKRLFWFNGISDEYLEKVYAISNCLFIPSEGEGFGLPLIEAAHYKKPIIARDIRVFREVAEGFAYYFENSNDSVILQKAIRKWLEMYKNGTHTKSDEMLSLTWEESVKILLRTITKV